MNKTSVGILGFGVEGKSTLRYLIQRGFQNIILMDKNEISLDNIPSDVSVSTFSGTNYLKGLKQCQTVIRSAGIYPNSKELEEFQNYGGVLKSQTEIFFDEIPKERIIAVTGTLGKGSTVSIIKHILDNAQIKNKIGGNFGIPMLDLLETDDNNTTYILELSSFQLMTLKKSPRIGVILKTTTEHLDWHKTVEEYRNAKSNLISYQSSDDYCIYLEDSDVSKKMAEKSLGKKLPFGSTNNVNAFIENYSTLSVEHEILKLSDCKIKGAYQLENMAAATLVALQFGLTPKDIFDSLKTYESLPMRMEFRGIKNQIEFYNDSYATRPDATLAAVKSMQKPFALILGGSEKNADFSELFSELKTLDKLKFIAFIGNTAERMYQEAINTKLNVSMEICETLEKAFENSLKLGKGSAVLLSPACASFGLFKNYKHRGEVFNNLVENL